jgi:regulator of nonsense transcripts 2
LLTSVIHNPVVVYEDEPSPTSEQATTNPLSTSQTTEIAPQSADGAQSSQSSEPSDLSKSIEDFSDHDEENDPIIHSFGPYGANILPRMASFHAGQSPIRPSRSSRNQPEPLRPADSPPQRSVPKTGRDGREALKMVLDLSSSIENHVINQLAFSRLSSTPFLTILNNLPTDHWNQDCSTEEGLSKDEIKDILESAKCIGKVSREGKDAAGKPLENEYYYVPDLDDDSMRREAVVNDLRKPGLRSCRKQHKQYFWRKPK